MANESFSDILNAPIDEAKAPPPLPIGTYQVVINKVPDIIRDRGGPGGSFDVIEFIGTVVQAQDDTDLSDYEGNVVGKPIKLGFLFDQTDVEKRKLTQFRLMEFLNLHLGLDIAGKSLSEALSMVPGSQCLFSTGIRMDRKNPERVYTEVKSTAAL